MAYQNTNRCSSDEQSPSDSIAVLDPKPLAVVAPPAWGVHPPIVASFNDRIRPLLDCVDKLRHLNIMQEGIQLPTIVVVGDQSSGKSSVLESLAGISLPRGQGICTRVPLIMRLQNDSNITTTNLRLEYNEKSLPVDEAGIADAIILATDEIAGHGKGISNNPLTLVVKKNGVPDLTMVDLPGITRVPVQGQPEDIYEQISDIIMKYIAPQESIILNVLSATVDFPTCESIRMSQKVDKTGERTLAVVTKADKAPEGLLEKVTADEVNIGLGYVCVRNRIGNESYEEARSDEARLFSTHPLLSKIDKSMVGIPVLAQKLVRIQASIISKCLPEIVGKINDKLTANVAELNRLPQHLTSVAEALTAFMRILSSSKESLKKVLLRGEFDEYPEEKEMHCTARLVEMLDQYSIDLHSKNFEKKGDFLMEEIMALEETKGIGLPNFLPRAVFLNVLQKKVSEIAGTPEEFVGRLWNYVERIVIKVLMYHCDNYPQLQSSTRRAAQNLILIKKNESVDWVREIIGMEKLTDYTCNPDYLATYSKLIAQQQAFIEIMNDPHKPSVVNLEGVGEIDVGHLRKHLCMVQQAFDMKMRVTAYWKLVLMRMVDFMALHIMFSIQKMVNKEMEEAIIQDLMAPHGGGIERMLDESPLIAEKRTRLNKSVKLLKESKDVVASIMDRISVHGEQEKE
ncbi:dynamin-related protein 4C-like [Nicotiana tabacum]|uniref:Dynamin-related protein 4C-like n=2 Tax=Nicotiana TaxID=4085 RepID=A0A1S3X3T4_TOBAC|nr:PREDICTED: dynamin-related protein 4C-like [Nicotiana sylvestris]XP_016434650.1 PREDICTED: dynamin-related protein 4C-like [Nicotiana tabacum]